MVIIDGLDEIDTPNEATLYEQLQTMAHTMSYGKVIATCRSGHFTNNLEGFNIVEIMPLAASKIEEVVNCWSKRPSEFMNLVSHSSYRPLLDRPLFLCQIILLFEEKSDLPDRASEVYRLVILLMIEKWDSQRRITRSGESAYSKLKSDRKLEILAALATELLYVRRRKVFSEQDLEQAFLGIYKKFRFSLQDRHQIISDIESHTGIIAKSSIDTYEFSHYTLQEYLCAFYIVRQPTLDLAVSSFHGYHEPIAIAVCLSSDSSMYFGQFVVSLKKKKAQSIMIR